MVRKSVWASSGVIYTRGGEVYAYHVGCAENPVGMDRWTLPESGTICFRAGCNMPNTVHGIIRPFEVSW